MGYVQRLDDGNTLIGWGATNPTVTIVSPEGEKLYELTFPVDVVSYRAYVFPWNVAGVTGIRDQPAKPAAFSLEQNFPNPSNPSTNIRYSLARDSHITLRVFNSLGQQIAQLVDGVEEAGMHSVIFQGAALASGVYLCRLQATDALNSSVQSFTQTRKLLLLR